MATETVIASQSGHWYDRRSAAPCYEVPAKSREGMRATNIGDARKLDLVPSVTLVLGAIAKPALEAWKAQKLLEASMTLPMQPGEVIDDYAKRVMEDAKAEGIAAADRGTQLHKAIELYIAGQSEPQWADHLIALDRVLAHHGIDIHAGKAEHTFSAAVRGLYYGGKVDYHTSGVLIDFKSKDKIEDKKRLVWDEHTMQLGAYGYGLFSVITSGARAWKWEPFRALNVFVGVSDGEVRVHEHSGEDLVHGFELFQCVLEFWARKNRFGPFAGNGGERKTGKASITSAYRRDDPPFPTLKAL